MNKNTEQQRSTEEKERWAGRHSDKDALRKRVWESLSESGAAIGSPWSRIPHFQGAKSAAQYFLDLEHWKTAQVVKCNPDRAQGWVRFNALNQGKKLYTPVPELTLGFPFVLLDPEVLSAKGVAFKEVMYAEGFLKHGQPIDFTDMEKIDFLVVGCVAVTRAGGRTGKGAGFADLEMGVFQRLGVMDKTTPVATTVHGMQLVPNDNVLMQSHDVPLDYIATPKNLIVTDTRYPRPGAIDWNALQPDQYRDIPFLTDLRDRLR